MFSSFMVNAWLAGTLVALAAGVTGLFVVIRGNTFAAHALPLGTFPGAAAATFLGIDQLVGLVACAALSIGVTSRRSRSDVATALTLITLLGLGTLFLSLSSRYSQAVYALLFGDILAINNGELIPVAIISAAVILLTCLFFRPLLLTSVSPDIAAATGVSNRLMELLFLSILALATAMSLPVVGALLVFSLMVGPASAARLITDRPLPAVCLSVAISLATIWSAIALSYVTN